MLNRKELRALSLLLWLPVIGWLVSTDAVVSLPHSAWHSTTEPVVVEEVRQVLPQGWAFFTRDPQESRTHLYKYGEDGWTAVPDPSVNAARSLFGIHRGARLYGHEVGSVIQEIPLNQWAECEQAGHVQCLQSTEPVPGLVAENPFTPPNICGTVGVIQQEPIPWAWRKDAESIQMPSFAAVVEVSCRP